jgi:hypothetical protein
MLVSAAAVWQHLHLYMLNLWLLHVHFTCLKITIPCGWLSENHQTWKWFMSKYLLKKGAGLNCESRMQIAEDAPVHCAMRLSFKGLDPSRVLHRMELGSAVVESLIATRSLNRSYGQRCRCSSDSCSRARGLRSGSTTAYVDAWSMAAASDYTLMY